MRSIEILIAIIIPVIGTIFTFSFGRLIAMDHMAGILGVPFLILLLIFCLILIFSKSSVTRKEIRIIITLYLLTLISYSSTILILRSRTVEVFEYLYSANAGDFSLAEILLFWYCGIGIILTATILFLTKNKKKGLTHK